MRKLPLLLVAVGALALVAAPPIVEAATPPSVAAVIEGTASNSGRGTLFVAGVKLNKFKTFSVLQNGTPLGAADLLVKGRSQITLQLPSGLQPGTYTLRLNPRRGDSLDVLFTYRVARNAFDDDLLVSGGATFVGDVGINRFPGRDLDVFGTARIGGTNSAFETFDLPTVRNTTLAATLRSTTTGVGPQFRFANAGTAEFMDIGNDGNSNFVVENQFDTAVLTVGQDGNSNFSGDVRVGSQFGNSRLYVNGPVFGDTAVGFTARDDATAILTLNREDGSQVLRVGSFGGNLLEMPQGNAFKPGGGSWGVFSDARLKKDVLPLTGALDKLMQLRSVEYEYKNAAEIGERPGRNVGFIAQEVEQVFPEWVGEKHDGMKYVAFTGFESLSVAALRELRAEKDAEIEALRAENKALADRLAAIEAALEALVPATEDPTSFPGGPDAR